jgi:hypothetical protein
MTPSTFIPPATVIGCPSCGNRLRVPDGLKVRAKVSCRRCGHAFRLGMTKPQAEPEVDRDGASATAEPAQRRAHRKTALLLWTSCFLVAVFGGIATIATFNSSDAEEPTADAIATADVTQLAVAATTESPNSAPEEASESKAASEATNDTWQVHELVMAQWSKDGYWYPARIEKQVGDQFEVRHLDGTEDTVSADKLAKDSLQEGDRVSVDFQSKGRYYAGKIVSRQGDKLRILYDDEDEEVTTIAAVRLWPQGEPVVDQDDEVPSYYTSTPTRNHVAEYQAYLNGEAELHRMYAARARQQEADIRVEAQQMQNDIMQREYYNYQRRLNNVVPGFQQVPSGYLGN